MSSDQSGLVAKVWNYAHVLRDQGISYGDYVEQISYLLFLKMDDERSNLIGEPSIIPPEYRWNMLASKDGDELELQYRHSLEELAKQPGIIGNHLPQVPEQADRPGQAKAGGLPHRRGNLDRPEG